MLKAIPDLIVLVIILSVIIYVVTSEKVLNKATQFCDKEVLIGKSSADLIAKSEKIGAKHYLASANSLNIYFIGSYRPAICRITILNGMVSAKTLEVAD